MPAIFPGSVRVFTTKVDLVDTVMASHVNLLQDEVTSVQTTLGTSLLSSTWAGVYSNTTSHINLSTRLINIEAGVKAANTTLAAISGTVVGTTDAQILTNKTITGGTVNPTTLQQGGIAAVTVSGTQTLTGKTLTNPTINAATITGAFASTATITGGTVNPATLQQGGVAAVTVSGSQTLTGKTLDNAIHTGIPTAPTAATVTNTDQIATTAYVKTLLGTSDGNIAAHTSSSVVHGATGAVVGTTNAQTLTSKTISGANNTISNIAQSSVTNLTTDLAAKAPRVDATFTGTVVLPATTSIGTITSTELGYVDGVTSAIQTQLNLKAPIAGANFTGVTTVVSPTATGSTGARQITISTADPTGGADGDLWIKYV